MTESTAEFLIGEVVASNARGGGAKGTGSVYTVRTTDATEYLCEYVDIVTEGFRTLKVGDVVRFTPVTEFGERFARQVLRAHEPAIEELYSDNTKPLVTPAEDLEER
jgi:hypothetical protein